MSDMTLVAQEPRFMDLSPEYAEIFMLAKVLQMSGYFADVRDQAQAVTKILFGRELGFSPIVSMSGIYIIEGKPALSANLLAATIKRSGKYDYRITAWDATQCEILFREKRDDQWCDIGSSRFDLDDAKRAGVSWKTRTGADTVWAKYPKAMLFARALSQGERAYCPDVSACALYCPEELGATVNASGEVLAAQDLPKSARPVEVTTEAIPIRKPSPVGPAAAVAHPPQTPERASPVAPQDVPQPPIETGVTIDIGKQRYFHRKFRESLPDSLQPQADALLKDWLRANGHVLDGKPSTKTILDSRFAETVEAAVSFGGTTWHGVATEVSGAVNP